MAVGIVGFWWFGPSPEKAFVTVFEMAPPGYVTELRLHYPTTPKSDAMYLGMVVPSEKVIELLGDHARGAYRMVDQGRIKPWDDEEIFRDQFPDCVFDKNELMMSGSTSPSTQLDFVYSVKDGYVFCTFWPDSSLDP